MGEINWKKHAVTFLVIFLVGGLLFTQARGCQTRRQPPGAAVRPADARLVELKIARWYIQAEVADTEQKRAKGLQGRKMLEPGYGMLFVLPELTRPSFWMKETKIPLSIAFLDSEGTIVQIEKGIPEDVTRMTPDAPCKYVLEVRRGWFEDRGLGPGTKVELPAELLEESAPPPPAGGPDHGSP